MIHMVSNILFLFFFLKNAQTDSIDYQISISYLIVDNLMN